jgi:hypothetical protein
MRGLCYNIMVLLEMVSGCFGQFDDLIEVSALSDGIPDKNLFMMCTALNPKAIRSLPTGYYIRNCRKSEINLWMGFPFDDPLEAEKYRGFMSYCFLKRAYLFVICKIVLLQPASHGELMIRSRLFTGTRF